MALFERNLDPDTFNQRRAERITELKFREDRQDAMDLNAAIPLDAATFWDEAGKALKWGGLSAPDELMETADAAGAEVLPTTEDIPEGAEGEHARQALAARGLRPMDPGPRPEVELFRNAFGAEEPTTAGGQIGASVVQGLVGAAPFAPAGTLMGTGKLAAGAAKLVGKVAPKLSQSPVAQAAGRGALEGQVMFSGSSFAAFDAAEKSAMVALNESPAFERFVWDVAASHNPDDPEWKQRAVRMAQDGVFGGIAGAAIGPILRAAVNLVKGRRAGQPGHVLDHPAKPAIREQQEVEAVADAVKLEHDAAALEVEETVARFDQPEPEAQTPRDDTPIDPDVDDEMLEQMEGFGRMGDEEQAVLQAEEGAAGGGEELPLVGLEQQPVDQALARAGEVLDEGASRAEMVLEHRAREAEKRVRLERSQPVVSAGGPITRSPVEVAERELVPDARATAREQDIAQGRQVPSASGAKDLNTVIWGTATDTGLREVAGPALFAAESRAGSAVADALVDPKNMARAEAAEAAVSAYRRVFSEEWRGARGKGWTPRKETAWSTRGEMEGWKKIQRMGMRDVGRLNPDLDPAAPSRVVASVRSQRVSEVREARPQDWGKYDEDAVLAAQRPEAMQSIVLPERVRTSMAFTPEEAADLPVDLHFGRINTPDDIAMAYNVVAEARAVDMGVDRTLEIQANRTREVDAEVAIRALRKQKNAEGSYAEKHKLQVKINNAKTARNEARSERRRLQAEKEANIKRGQDAETALRDLMHHAGYRGPGVFRVTRNGVDPVMALHLIEATMGSLQRTAQSASSDAVASTQRAAGIRSLHTADGVMKWIRGDDKGVREALERADLEVEDGALLKLDPETPEIQRREVARRLSDNTLVAKSGGSQRVQAWMSGIALSRDAGQVLNMLSRWREDARYAWSATERWGLHNFQTSVLQERFGSMLSNVSTMTMNTGSAFIFTKLNLMERYISGLYSARSEGISGALDKAAREAGEMARALPAGYRDGLHVTKADAEIAIKGEGARATVEEKLDAKNLRRVYEDLGRLDQFENFTRTSMVGVPEVIKDAAADTRLEGFVNVVDRVLDLGLTYGTKAARGGDMLFKGVNNRVEMHRLAGQVVRERHGLADNLEGVDKSLYRQEVEDLVSRPTEEMRRNAAEFAHTSTFTRETIPIVEKYITIMNRYPNLRWLTPFVRTGTNVAVEGYRRTPFAATMKTERDAWRAGGESRRDLLARQTTGQLVNATMGGLVLAGLATGSPPRDEQLRKAWLATGKKPYSIKIGGKWWDYRQLPGPLPVVIHMWADAWSLGWAAATDEEYSAFEAITDWTLNEAEFLMTETFLEQFTELNGLVGEHGSTEKAGRWLRNQVESVLPDSSIMRRRERMFRHGGYVPDYTASGGFGGKDERFVEKAMEEWETLYNTVTNRYFWWLGGDNPYPRYNHYGEPLSYQTAGPELDVWDQVLGFIGPAPYTIEATHPLAQAERRLGFVPRWFPRTRVVTLGKNSGISRVLEYTPEEYAWLSKRSGEIYKSTGLHQVQLANFINDDEPVQKEALEMLAEAARRQAINEFDTRMARGGPKDWPAMRANMERAQLLMQQEKDAQRHGGVR